MDTNKILTAAALALIAGDAFSQENRPNILYIMSDDHAFQAISAYGSAVSAFAPTPNIDRIALNGIRFDRAFVENSLSAPSRACTITGLYSHQNGQRQLCEGIDTSCVFVSELLQQAGYQTGIVGKWHLMCEPKGFDYYHVLNDQGTYYNPVFKSQDSNGEYIQEEGYATELITDHAIEFLEHRDPSKPFFLMVHHKAPHRSWIPATQYLGMYDDVEFPMPETFNDDYSTRGSAARTQKMSIVADMNFQNDLKVSPTRNPEDGAEKYVREFSRMTPDQQALMRKYFEARNRAFCAADLKGDDLAKWKYETYLRDYLAVIHSVDESVGKLLDYIESSGLLDNTIVIYASDQGFYMGEHGWFDKRFMYEESLRTPLVMMYRGHITPGLVSDAMVQNIDYAPTFLDLAGVQQPKEMTGRSLRPLFTTGKTGSWRNDIYYHYYDYPTWHMVRKHDGVRDDRYKLIHFYGKGGPRAQSENKYQNTPGTVEYKSFVNMVKSGYITDQPDVDYYELYDLKQDPHELNNLYGNPEYDGVAKKLMKRLKWYRRTLKVDE
jgi:arylsulfatase A-like enzyme